MTVRTRFAPSPTGYLHIGGVRTALFNWLLARRHGGQFILRIDDTDASRHVEEAVELIQSGFRWLGMNWDEGPVVGGPHAPYFQSQRKDKHEAAVLALLEAGWAYPCKATAQELEVARMAAVAAKRPYVHRGALRVLTPAESVAMYKAEKPAIRFKVPLGETTVLDDKVRGKVEWQTDLLGDFTIARAGGDPLYNLASIVDDIAMKITHIVRAEEHLSNTHPQMLIARGLGAELPIFAHVPYVAAPGGKKKLSKRNPPKGVIVALEGYQEAGYLPEAMLNALVRLGWSLDDRSEIIPLETMIANFSLDRVTSAAASLDPDKMFWIEDHYMRQLDPAERVERLLPFLQKKGFISTPATEQERATVAKIDAASGDRIKLLSDIVRYGGFFFSDKLEYDEKAAKTLLAPDAPAQLARIRDGLKEVTDFTVPSIEAVVRRLSEELGIGGKINHLLRAATTGQSVGAGIYDCLSILGKQKVIARIEQTLSALAAGQVAGKPAAVEQG